MRKAKVESLWRALLVEIGDDPLREGLIDTPARIAKSYSELFKGYDDNQFPKVTTFKEGKFYKGEGLIIDKGYFFSFCEHHVLPFFGNYYFGYIPKECYIGASKIARIIDHFSSRLQVAERLCWQVVDFLEGKINPHGIILLMSGRHLCKEMRGVKKYDSSFEVTECRGCFRSNKDNCKDEFTSRIGYKL